MMEIESVDRPSVVPEDLLIHGSPDSMIESLRALGVVAVQDPLTMQTTRQTPEI